MRLRAALALFLIAPACRAADQPGSIILPGSAMAGMLNQCSRDAPEAGEDSWQPEPGDIAPLEAALPGVLQSRPETRGERSPHRPDWATAPNGWKRQYVGIVRGGRRFVYGNFYPPERSFDGSARDRSRREPTIICDGGPVFFGVEYDVEARRFTHIAFNGAI